VRVDASVVNGWFIKALARKYRLFTSSEISVTEAVAPCLRRAYYNRVRRYIPTPVEALKIIGSRVHTVIQEVLRSEGWDVEVGVSIDLGGWRLVGRADAVKDDVVLEFKTVNGVLEEPYESHRLQLQAYLTILHAREGYLVYIDRASGKVKVFKVRPSKTALREVIERARKLKEALEEGQPPPPTRGPWCNTCPHKWHCLKEVRGRDK